MGIDYMNNQESLTKFLSGVLSKRWRKRYLELIEKKKGKLKFLQDLYHVFEEKVNENKIVPGLSDSVLSLSAFSYSEIGGFGKEEESMRQAKERYAGNGCLVIDRNGQHGIYMPEDIIDDILFLSI